MDSRKAAAAALITALAAHDMGASGFLRPLPPVLRPPPAASASTRPPGTARSATLPPRPLPERPVPARPSLPAAPSLAAPETVIIETERRPSSIDLIRPMALERAKPVLKDAPRPPPAAKPTVLRRTQPARRASPAMGRLKLIPYLADMVAKSPGLGRLGAMTFRQDPSAFEMSLREGEAGR